MPDYTNTELRIHVPPMDTIVTVQAANRSAAQALYDHLTEKGVRVDMVTWHAHIESGGQT